MAVVIVASVTATNDYNKQLQFRALAQESKRRVEVPVRRAGETLFVGTVEIVVGDVVTLGEQEEGEGAPLAQAQVTNQILTFPASETGALVPADGIVLRSSDLKVNESALTGESDDIVKHEGSAPVLLAGSQVGGAFG